MEDVIVDTVMVSGGDGIVLFHWCSLVVAQYWLVAQIQIDMSVCQRRGRA